MTQSVTSDRDYLEIVLDGDITLSTGSGDADADFPQTIYLGAQKASTTVTHSLGSIPIVRAFYDAEKNGTYYNTTRWDNSDFQGSNPNPNLMTVSTTTTTKLLLNSNSSETNIPVYYRIYRFGTRSVTSDERIDKIFDKGTDSTTLGVASGSTSPVQATSTIAHGQGEVILWTLQFSDDQTNWYNEGAILNGPPDTSSGPPGGPYARNYYVTAYGYCDSTNFYIRYISNYGSSKTIYTRFVWDYKT